MPNEQLLLCIYTSCYVRIYPWNDRYLGGAKAPILLEYRNWGIRLKQKEKVAYQNKRPGWLQSMPDANDVVSFPFHRFVSLPILLTTLLLVFFCVHWLPYLRHILRLWVFFNTFMSPPPIHPRFLLSSRFIMVLCHCLCAQMKILRSQLWLLLRRYSIHRKRNSCPSLFFNIFLFKFKVK